MQQVKKPVIKTAEAIAEVVLARHCRNNGLNK